MYLDEIDEILAVMRSIGPVEVETEDFTGEVESAADLKTAGKELLTELKLTVRDQIDGKEDERQMTATAASHGGYLSYLRTELGTMITPGDDLPLVGAERQVQETMIRAQRRFGGLAGWFGIFASYVAGVYVALVVVDVTTKWSTATAVLVGLVMGIALVTSVTLLRATVGTNKNPSGVVLLVYRSEAPTWWHQNKTGIFISIATNVLVGIGFFLLGFWVG